MARHLITLRTVGRFTGRPRPVTLYAFDDEASGGLVVVGSKGGFPRDPAWCENLRTEPGVTIDDGATTWAVVAREVDGAERDRLWSIVCEGFSNYASYERKAGRRIPLFVLGSGEVGPVG